MLSRTPSALSHPTSDDEWEEVEEVEEVEAGMATVTVVSKVEAGIAKVTKASWKKLYSRYIDDVVGLYRIETHHVVFVTQLTDEMKTAVYKTFPFAMGPGNESSCTCCRTRAFSILTYRDIEGNPCFMSASKDCYHEDLHLLWEAARTGTIIGMRMATKEMFVFHSKGGFGHISINTDADIQEYTSAEVDKYNRVLAKYDPMFHTTFTENGKDGLHKGLMLLKEAIPKITYGDKLEYSVDWLLKHVPEDYTRLSLLDQMKVRATAMLSSTISGTAGSQDPVIQVFHQAKSNTLDALACAYNIKALTTLLADRFSPRNYQVKTAAPTTGNVKVAMELIGEFSAKLMTLAGAIGHGATPIGTSTHKATSAYDMLLGGSKSSKKGGAAAFASRCVETKFPTTLADLVSTPPDDLEIYTDSMTPVYANEFIGLKDGVYQFPFTWGFVTKSPKSFGMSGYHRVLAILQFGRSMMFICKGASKDTHMTPCCHVSLLTPEYNRICGPTWGNMSSVMTLDKDIDGPPAIGVGTSYANIKTKRLSGTPLKFRVGTKCFTISK